MNNIATSAPSVSFSENEAPTRPERASPELLAACAEPKRGKIEMMKKAVLAMHMAIVLMGCGGDDSAPAKPAAVQAAQPEAGAAVAPTPAQATPVPPEAGPDLVTVPDASPPPPDAGASEPVAPSAPVMPVALSCYPTGPSNYCPIAGSYSYWCSSAPGAMSPPAYGCVPLDGSFWDGGTVVSQGWCCPPFAPSVDGGHDSQ